MRRKITGRQIKVARKLAKTRLGIVILVLLIVVSAAITYYEYKKQSIDPDASAEFHFIDVGQGDAAMIVTDEVHILVDCGTGEYADTVIEYVRKYTDKVDLFVFSHPHDDHMGGAADVMSALEVSEVLMADGTSDARFFERALDVIEEKNITLTEAVAGKSYKCGDVMIDVFSPARDYEDHNNNSIIMKATVDGASVMFTGDAETPAESDVLKSYAGKLSSNVLKVGHHGSATSSSRAFVEAVDPEYAVVSCGKDNSYGHPHREIVALFSELEIPTYRTDKEGDIVLICRDGKIEKK